MWGKISDYFKRSPAQEKVANILLKYGLRVTHKGIFCGNIEIPVSAVADAIGGDRRAVTATIHTILTNHELEQIFSKLLPVANLKDIAPDIGWGVIDVAISGEADKPGILSNIVKIISDSAINIKQVVVEDVGAPLVHVVIITEKTLHGDTIHCIRKTEGVKSITLFS